MKRLLTLLVVLALVVSLFSGLQTTVSAATVNSATRHVLCTALSSQAKAYYTGSYSWNTLSGLPGSSSTSSLTAMNSQLYSSLHNLMSSTLKTQVTYSSLTTHWKTTDAQNGTSGATMIYADSPIQGSDVVSREHVWPKSHASFQEKNGGADLHHLRPEEKNVNSARGNRVMGNVRGKTSNPSTYSYAGKTVLYSSGTSADSGLVEVNDNVKGDVARILLYVYVTWQQPNLFENVSSANLPPMDSDDDKSDGLKVIESLDTLLQWMQIDPVDNWEMTRNDLCQNIQGNRNVFIDYPELAWMLFNRTIPTTYDTPSGYAKSGAIAYTLTARSNNTAYGTVSVSGTTVTAAPKTGYYAKGYTLSPSTAAKVTQDGNLFYVTNMTADATLTVNFAARAAAAITFKLPAGVTVGSYPTSGLYVGDTITLPTVSGTPANTGSVSYTFRGWSTTELNGATTATILSAGSDYTLKTTADVLYPVYSYLQTGSGDSGSYHLVTSVPSDWSGSYVIANTKASAAMTCLNPNSTAANPYLAASDVTISDDTIYNPAADQVWTIAKSGSYYTIESSEGQFLRTTVAKSVTLTDTAEDSALWTLGVNSIASKTSSRGSLYYNSSYPRFTTYTSAQAPIALYKGDTGTVCYTSLLNNTQPDPDPEPEDAVYRGQCGSKLYWELSTATGTLSITGTGAMYTYSSTNRPGWDDYRSSVRTVTVASGATSIGSWAFYDCGELENITLCSTIASIGDNAFYRCSSLLGITVPSGVAAIESGTFQGCHSLLYCELPATVSTIGSYAFYGCTSLGEITLPAGLTEIPAYTFYACRGLTALQLPEGITTIGREAFSYCTGLTALNLPSTVTWLGNGSLKHLDSIRSLTIPAAVNRIDDFAFQSCGSMEDVIFQGNVPTISKLAFLYDRANAWYMRERNWTAADLQNYGGVLTWNASYLHELREENVENLPESSHPYTAHSQSTKTVSAEGAIELWLTFSSGSTLANGDTLTVKDENGNTVATLTGSLSNQELVVPGSKATLTLTSNGSTTAYGYALSNVLAIYFEHKWVAGEVITPASSFAEGLRLDHCQYCDATHEQTIAPTGRASTFSVSMKDSLRLNAFVDKALYSRLTDAYLEFVKATYDAEGNRIGQEISKISTYEDRGTELVFTLGGIAAREMSSAIDVTICGKLNGKEVRGGVRSTSIVKYSSSIYKVSAGNEKIQKLIVNMLNYGAAYQQLKNYNLSHLANASLTAEQQQLVADQTVEWQNDYKVSGNKSKAVTFYTYSVSLLDSVTINIYVRTSEYAGRPSDLNIACTFAGKTEYLPGSQLQLYGTTETGETIYKLPVTLLSASQMREPITFEFYETSGNTKVSGSLTYSIASYANANHESSDVKLAKTVTEMMKYGDSAYAYANR